MEIMHCIYKHFRYVIWTDTIWLKEIEQKYYKISDNYEMGVGLVLDFNGVFSPKYTNVSNVIK